MVDPDVTIATLGDAEKLSELAAELVDRAWVEAPPINCIELLVVAVVVAEIYAGPMIFPTAEQTTIARFCDILCV